MCQYIVHIILERLVSHKGTKAGHVPPPEPDGIEAPQYNSTMVGVFPEVAVMAVAVLGVVVRVMRV
jgi:hypothetical protein